MFGWMGCLFFDLCLLEHEATHKRVLMGVFSRRQCTLGCPPAQKGWRRGGGGCRFWVATAVERGEMQGGGLECRRSLGTERKLCKMRRRRLYALILRLAEVKSNEHGELASNKQLEEMRFF